MRVLRLDCIDQPGIVAAVATTLSNNQCNIEESSQFFDRFSGRFFMRVVFQPLEAGATGRFTEGFRANAARFDMKWDVCDLSAKIPTLIMVSKADHCLHDLLYRAQTASLNIDIKAIASNHMEMKPLANQHNIPFHYIPIEHGRETAEALLEKLVAETGSELILLARYMQILSQQFCSKFPEKIINIHHSFLPGFKGAKPYHQAYERGVKIIGATAHYATSDLDEGPIIAQDIEHINHALPPEKMQQIGRDIEKLVLAKATQLYTERRIFCHSNRTVIL